VGKGNSLAREGDLGSEELFASELPEVYDYGGIEVE